MKINKIISSVCVIGILMSLSACSNADKENNAETSTTTKEVTTTEKASNAIKLSADNYSQYFKIDTSVDINESNCEHDKISSSEYEHSFESDGSITIDIAPIKNVKFENVKISGYLCLSSSNDFEYWGHPAYEDKETEIEGWTFRSGDDIRKLSYMQIYAYEARSNYNTADTLIRDNYPYFQFYMDSGDVQGDDVVYKFVDITIPLDGYADYSDDIKREESAIIESVGDYDRICDSLEECVGTFVVTNVSGTISE